MRRLAPTRSDRVSPLHLAGTRAKRPSGLPPQRDPNNGQPRWTGCGLAGGDGRAGSPHPALGHERGQAPDGFEDPLIRFGIVVEGYAVALFENHGDL